MACFLVSPVHQNRFLSLRQFLPETWAGLEPDFHAIAHDARTALYLDSEYKLEQHVKPANFLKVPAGPQIARQVRSAGPTIRRELVLDAVLTAVRRRPRGTIIHSDQGTQYGSDAWRRFCRSNHLEPNMSRKGNCWDNPVAESFFSSLKKERIKKHIYRNRELATADVADYIDSFYSRTTS